MIRPKKEEKWMTLSKNLFMDANMWWKANWDKTHVIFSIYDLLKARATKRKGKKKMKKKKLSSKTVETHIKARWYDKSEICMRNLNDMTFKEIVEKNVMKLNAILYKMWIVKIYLFNFHRCVYMWRKIIPIFFSGL